MSSWLKSSPFSLSPMWPRFNPRWSTPSALEGFVVTRSYRNTLIWFQWERSLMSCYNLYCNHLKALDLSVCPYVSMQMSARAVSYDLDEVQCLSLVCIFFWAKHLHFQMTSTLTFLYLSLDPVLLDDLGVSQTYLVYIQLHCVISVRICTNMMKIKPFLLKITENPPFFTRKSVYIIIKNSCFFFFSSFQIWL